MLGHGDSIVGLLAQRMGLRGYMECWKRGKMVKGLWEGKTAQHGQME